MGVIPSYMLRAALGVLAALGDTRSTATLTLTGGVLQVILAPALIWGAGPLPALGIAGAGWAMVASWSGALGLGLVLLARRHHLKPSLPMGLSGVLSSWSEFFRVSAAATASQLLLPATAAVLTRGLTVFGGSATVAAYAVGQRLEASVLAGPLALNAALAPVAGQAFGEDDPERTRTALLVSVRLALAWVLPVAAILAAGAPTLAAVFSDDRSTIEPTVWYLRLVPATVWCVGVSMLVTTALYASQRGAQSMMSVLTRFVGCVLPGSLIGGALGSGLGVFAGLAIGNALAGAAAWWWATNFAMRRPDSSATRCSSPVRGQP